MENYLFFLAQYQRCQVKMCRSKVLLVLDMHLIYATFLKVDLGTDNYFRVKDPFKHLTWNVLTKLVQVVFIFIKIIHPRLGIL